MPIQTSGPINPPGGGSGFAPQPQNDQPLMVLTNNALPSLFTDPQSPAITGGNGSSGGVGVQGFASGSKGAGVQGIGTGGAIGVVGSSDSADAIHGECSTKNGSGVSGNNHSGGPGVYGNGTPAGYFEGDLQVTGTIKMTGAASDIVFADFAEDFDATGVSAIEPGTVMVLTEDGIAPCGSSYDRKVAGVVSGAGNFRPAMILDNRGSSSIRATLALVGKVYCKVDADYSPVDIGDLLTTSSTRGYAMKAADPTSSFGAVIGKALRPLKSGQGIIPVLVALQ